MNNLNFNCFYRTVEDWQRYFDSTNIFDEILSYCEDNNIDLMYYPYWSNIELFDMYIKRAQLLGFAEKKGIDTGFIFEALELFKVIRCDTF